MNYFIQDFCCICLSISNEKCSNNPLKHADYLPPVEKIKIAFLGLSSVMENDYKICLKCSETVGFIYEFHKTCVRNIQIFSSYKNILKENQLKKQCGLSVDLNKSKTFEVNTLTSVEIKLEPPEEPLNNYDTLYDAHFLLENHTSGVAEIKKEIDIDYDICDGQSETFRLGSKIKIESEETVLKRECMNETSDVESLKSNTKDFENIFDQSTKEVIGGEEENQELIEDPLQGVVEEKSDVGRGLFDFIRINHSIASEEKPNDIEKNVGSDSHSQLIHSEKKNYARKKPLKCIFCGQLFTWRSQLNTHKLIHTAVKPHKCNICEKSFKTNVELKIHSTIHTGEKPHRCDICGKFFRRRHHLNLHNLSHTGEKPHKCEICEKLFTDKTNLKRHMLIHLGEKPHKCEICEKLFTDKANLRRHMLIHSGERSHKCDICEKLFTDKANLKRHMIIHSDVKPHKCDICDKLFTDKTYLKRHMLTHSDEKSHKCDICGKLFGRIQYLNSHKLIHNDEKPHECDVCGKLFKRKSDLKKHSATHTGELINVTFHELVI